jgi:nucleoside-diphosphate-sugar epimerase
VIPIAYETALSAINGTVGLLKAVKNNAPSVKRVVVTSSGAAILDFSKPPTYTFTEVKAFFYQSLSLLYSVLKAN